MDKLKMAEKLWDMANLLTGFAVAQALATTFALARCDLKALDDVIGDVTFALLAAMFTIFYRTAILRCCDAGWRLNRRPENADEAEAQLEKVWRDAKQARIVAVYLFTFVLAVAFFGHIYRFYWLHKTCSSL